MEEKYLAADVVVAVVAAVVDVEHIAASAVAAVFAFRTVAAVLAFRTVAVAVAVAVAAASRTVAAVGDAGSRESVVVYAKVARNQFRPDRTNPESAGTIDAVSRKETVRTATIFGNEEARGTVWEKVLF